MRLIILIFILFSSGIEASESLGQAPVAYRGRIRPMEAYSQLWLYQLSNKSAIDNEILWRMQFSGHSPLDETPLFWIGQAKQKEQLGLDVKSSRFSYNTLSPLVREDFPDLLGKIKEYESVDQLKMLPSKRGAGQWLPLSALKSPTNNTLYSNELYQKLRKSYLEQDIDDLSKQLVEGYQAIAGTVYQETSVKQLRYPTLAQMKLEYLYYRYPLISLTASAYGLAMILLLFTNRSLLFALIPFAMHTLILAMRSFILGRPPVSNMFETIIYVPWIAVLMGFILRSRTVLFISLAGAFTFLLFLQFTRLDSGMENVQAVLDSQFWLMIHVLMVVGSYGLFVLGGLLAHYYLGYGLYYRKVPPNIAKYLIQIIYIGTILLVCGTILGGVWAAESWGRFWDWDPKESWAFISSCVYLIIIHLYRFRLIHDFGLAVGAIIGLSAIAFTWYGVNYILGTGLHSYGFGSGGEQFFYFYLILEMIFISLVFWQSKNLHKMRPID